jgi:hypothetical protein
VFKKDIWKLCTLQNWKTGINSKQNKFNVFSQHAVKQIENIESKFRICERNGPNLLFLVSIISEFLTRPDHEKRRISPMIRCQSVKKTANCRQLRWDIFLELFFFCFESIITALFFVPIGYHDKNDAACRRYSEAVGFEFSRHLARHQGGRFRLVCVDLKAFLASMQRPLPPGHGGAAATVGGRNFVKESR